MLSKRDFQKVSANVSSCVRGVAQCFLFIGENTDGIDFERIAKEPWSGVISSANNAELCAKFNLQDRKSELVKDIDASVPNRKNMPFYDLKYFVKEYSKAEKGDDYDEEEEENEYKKIVDKVFGMLVKGMNILYAVGYDPSVDNIGLINFKKFGGRASFFGISENELDQKLKDRIKKYGLICYEEKLEDFLPDEDADEDIEYAETDENDVLFYSNKKLWSLSYDDLQKTREFLTLANRADLEQNLPFSKEIQKLYFQKKFLGAAPDSPPQWYAFSRIGFAVKRPFETYLFSIVENALSDTEKMPDGKKYDPRHPIILMGSPSSSKTIGLGALAYHIFRQEKNPVIFVYRNAMTDERKESLSNLMEKISDRDPNCRILLICDFSSYVNSFDQARELAGYLHDLGRRFVLVMSSFEHPENNGRDPVDYGWNSENKCFERISSGNGADPKKVLTGTSGFWIVRSSREVTDGEFVSIQKIFKDYGGLDLRPEIWKSFRENSSDIFEIFFKLTDLVRNSMVIGLDLEKKNLADYHRSEMKRIYNLNRRKSEGTVVIKRIDPETGKIKIEAVSLDELVKKSVNEDEKSGQTGLSPKPDNGYPEAFQKFQDCVAVLSQYAIKTPMSLAMAFFSNEKQTVFYSTDRSVRELTNFLMYSIPWIHCTETEDGNYEFSFRNTEEAIIHVKNSFLSTDKYGDYLKFILELFSMYRSMEHIDQKIVYALTVLLQQLGPNSSDWNGYEAVGFKDYFKANMSLIIGKLDEIIRANLDYSYGLSLAMITLRREYYGYQSKNSAELRKTIKYCDDIIDKMNDRPFGYSNKQMAQIVNEKVLCEILLHQIDGANDFYSSFESLFSAMETLIFQDPENGYYYHTILSLFEEWSPNNPKNKLSYCGRLAAVIEQSSIYEVRNRGKDGNDNLSKQISKFYEFVDNKEGTTIDKFNELDESEDFRKRFDEAVKNRDSSYIWLICYNEMKNCSLMGAKKINTEVKRINTYMNMTCKKVYDFMKRYYDDAVKYDLTALRMMLRVYWLSEVSEEPQISNTPENECRLTKFSHKQWEIINLICKDYQDLCSRKELPGAPFMRYMYALSTLCTKGISSESLRQCQHYLGQKTNVRYIEKNEQRMFSQFILCDEKGEPFKFQGYIKDIKTDKKGTMTITVNRSDFECEAYCANIGLRSMNDLKTNSNRGTTESFGELVLGAGYSKLQVYALKVVENKEKKRSERNGG